MRSNSKNLYSACSRVFLNAGIPILLSYPFFTLTYPAAAFHVLCNLLLPPAIFTSNFHPVGFLA